MTMVPGFSSKTYQYAGFGGSDPKLTIEPVRGWRCWVVSGDLDSPHLKAMSWPYEWTVDVNTARCLKQAAPCDYPSKNCGCGFYGYHAREYYNQPSDYHRQFWIQGLIEGWGRTIIGNKGFRCQFAKILGITAPIYMPADFVVVNQLTPLETSSRILNGLRKNYPDIAICQSEEALIKRFAWREHHEAAEA